MGRAKRRPGGAGDGAVERGLDLRHDLDRLGRPAGVLQPQRHLRRPGAGADDPAHAAGQQLEVGVPDPGDVAAVGDPVVERDPEVEPLARSASSRSVRSTSLAPAGFLISRIETGVPPTSIVSTRPKAARISPRAAAIRSGATPEPQRRRRPRRARCRRCRGRAAAAPARSRRRGCARSTREPVHPAQLDRASRRRRAAAARRRSWGRSSGRGGRRRRARRRRGGRSGGSAWRRRRAGARAAPARRPRCRSR